MSEYWMMSEDRTFAFSAENPEGKKNGGSGLECSKIRPNIKISPGETAVLCDTDGPGVIQHMWFTGYVGHSFILRVYYEGREEPSVEAPISAFFGCAYDENFTDRDGKYPTFSSAVMMTAPGRGFNSYFQMPFRKHIRITMENRGREDQWLYYMITGVHGAVPEEALYFHASYRQAHPVEKGHTYTVIDGIAGKGQFVGMTMAAGMNGNNTCWVEGEARMYIDGEDAPSIHYTGTEDYFCGSYGFGNDIYTKNYQTYSGLYSGMFSVIGDNSDWYNGQQRFLLYRFHIQDPIHFEKSFRMTFDNLGWTGPRYDDYTTVAYWYQTLPACPLKALPSDDEMVMK